MKPVLFCDFSQCGSLNPPFNTLEKAVLARICPLPAQSVMGPGLKFVLLLVCCPPRPLVIVSHGPKCVGLGLGTEVLQCIIASQPFFFLFFYFQMSF